MSTASKYLKLSDIEHVLKRPGRYLGSIVNHTAIQWVVESGQMIRKEVTWNPALIKTFDEIISNAVDHSKRPEGKHLDTIKVELCTLTKSLSVYDNGGIPVEVHPEYDQWIPEMIFSELRAGTNFDDEEESDLTGQNGEGAALTAIFSSSFTIETADGKKSYRQVFTDNLSEKSKPEVRSTKQSYTKITWIPDYEKFNTDLDDGNVLKIIKRIYDIAACNPHLKIFFNGTKINIPNFKKYISMYTSDFVYDENDDWQIGVASSEDGFQHVSFVNSSETAVGGTHIDYVSNQIVNGIREFLKKKHKVDVKPAQIKNHLMIFVNARIMNPRYDSQTKENLITEISQYGTKYQIDDKTIRKICSTDIVQNVLEWIEAKLRKEELAELRKRQKENRKKKVPAHIAASSKNREKCVLFLAEGLSALSMWINVRDSAHHGAFPLRGKPVNVSNMTPVEIAKNKEIAAIMSILGLEFNKTADDLNYGQIWIMTDADVDGSGAIACLLVNFFASFWPELFEAGRVKIVRTPIIIATHRRTKKVVRYYDLSDYTDSKISSETHIIDYVKGLGSLSKEEYDLAVNKPVLETIRLDDIAWLQMAFGDSSQERKNWLMGEK